MGSAVDATSKVDDVVDLTEGGHRRGRRTAAVFARVLGVPAPS